MPASHQTKSPLPFVLLYFFLCNKLVYLWCVSKVNKQLHGSLINITDNHFCLSALCQLASEHRPEQNIKKKHCYCHHYYTNWVARREILPLGTWSRGCRPTGLHGERKSSWHPPPAPHHRAPGVSSAGWSPLGSAAGACLICRACVLAGGPLQGAY